MQNDLRDSAINSGHRRHCDLPRAGSAQHARTFIQRRSRRINIIDDYYVSVFYTRGSSHDECSTDILPPLMTG